MLSSSATRPTCDDLLVTQHNYVVSTYPINVMKKCIYLYILIYNEIPPQSKEKLSVMRFINAVNK